MPNNTETYWEANGESLHTYARSITTLSGLGPPPTRGSNVIVPLHPGRKRVDKVFDENVLTLAMWLRGVAQDAGAGVSSVSKMQYQKNWNDLIRLLYNSGEEFPLRKRFYDGATSSVIAATAMAEYSSGLEPTMMGRSGAKCSVDLRLADPRFYADVLFSQNLVNGDNNVVIPGNVITHNIVVTIQGSRTNTKIRNKTTGVEFTYPQALSSGDQVAVDVNNFLASVTPNGQPTYDGSVRIIHDGSPLWLNLKPGTNVINVSSASGIGVITLQARGAWI